MRRARSLIALVLLAVACPAGAAPDSGIAWRDWDRGLEEAKASGRPVLVDVYTQWCGWCRRMDADVYARTAVRDYLRENFVTVKLDAEAANPARYEGRAHTSRSLAARFGVSGYPTTLFLRPGGDHMVSVPGYVGGDRFLLVLRYVREGHMDRGVSFEAFSKQAAAGSGPRR